MLFVVGRVLGHDDLSRPADSGGAGDRAAPAPLVERLVFQLADVANDPVEPAWGQIILATVVSFVIGYAVIAWLLRYISTHDFLPFVIYRLSLAAVVAVLLLTGFLEPLPGPYIES